MKRRANKHRPKDANSHDNERRHTNRCTDKSEKNFDKYGVVAVMLDQDTEEGYEDKTDD